MPILDKIALQKKKKISEHMLVEELLAELQFINDVLAERAENRKDFAEKVVEVITYGVSKVFSAGAVAHPLTAIGQIATDIIGDVIQKILQHSKEKNWRE